MSAEDQPLSVLFVTESETPSESVIRNASIMASIFNAKLIWVKVHFKELAGNTEQLHEKLPYMEEQSCITYHLHYSKLNTVFELAEQNNALMGILEVNKTKSALQSPKKVMRFVRKSRIPILVVQDNLPNPEHFKNIVLPLDYLQQAKEKALWASYFSAYNHSKIYVLTSVYKDEYYLTHTRNNLKFTERMYKNLDVEYETASLADAGHKLDAFAIAYASKINAGLMLLMTTLDYNLDDWLWGPPELKVIQNKEKVPVLCLNQRNDIYVLCS
jgi:hypothetical protein